MDGMEQLKLLKKPIRMKAWENRDRGNVANEHMAIGTHSSWQQLAASPIISPPRECRRIHYLEAKTHDSSVKIGKVAIKFEDVTSAMKICTDFL